MKKILPSHFFRKLLRRSWRTPVVRSIVPDEWFLKNEFKIELGRKLNLKDPKSFNEKLQWLKLYDRNPIYTTLVDKYKAKEYVAEKIGEQYVIPLLGVWDRFDDIDFSKLPEQFVLKCNHDSGNVFICKDKSTFDYKLAKKKLERSLKKNYFYYSREWPYKNVPRKIIAEQLLMAEDGSVPSDYKIMCFNGVPKLIYIYTGRFTNNKQYQDWYDADWNKLEVQQPAYPSSTQLMKRPSFLDEALELSRKLASGIPCLRIDWYFSNQRLYLGEMTFFDCGGFGIFEPSSFEELLGSWITLPACKQKN